MKFVAPIAIVLSLAAGAAAAQAGPLEWRRRDPTPEVSLATGFSSETDGSRYVTLVTRVDGDRQIRGTSLIFRGSAVRSEVRCAERRWRILGMTHYAADYTPVQSVPGTDWSPLGRETPLHAAITDVCEGGHTGPAALKTEDEVAVQRWLDGG